MKSEIELLRFQHKRIRAVCIKEYMEEAGYESAVCFSCGNAASELEKIGVDVLHIGIHGVMTPNVWFAPVTVKKAFKTYFDATSGHLPIDCMNRLARAYKRHLGALHGTVYVPCGSGETLVCLKLAYPQVDFVAVYNIDEATEYSEFCVLNGMVRLLASKIIFADKKGGEELSPEKESMTSG